MWHQATRRRRTVSTPQTANPSARAKYAGDLSAWYADQYAYQPDRSATWRFALSQVDQCAGISGLRCRSPLVRSTYAAAGDLSSSRRTSVGASAARRGTTFPLLAGGSDAADVMI